MALVPLLLTKTSDKRQLEKGCFEKMSKFTEKYDGAVFN